MQIDKRSFDDQICFNDEKHKYFKKDSNEDFISVTTLIHKFTQDFDEEFWSRYKALQKLIGQDEFDGPVIKKKTAKTKEQRAPASLAKQSLLETKQYDHKWTLYYNLDVEILEKEASDLRDFYTEERDRSCFRGTNIHKDMENLITSKSQMTANLLGLGDKIEGAFKFSYDNKELLPGNVYPEILLYRISNDGQLRIAGQVDLLIVDHDGGVYIIDFKTNKKLDMKSYFNTKTKRSVKMKYPLNNLDDCNFKHYEIQLSLYYWLVNKANPNLFLKGLYILHFDHEGNENTYECEYLKDEVERMLSFHKQQKAHDEFKSTREKINY
jgi:hypothetical protein